MAEKKLNLNALLKETDAEEALAATLEEIPDEIPKEIKEVKKDTSTDTEEQEKVKKTEEKPRVHLDLSSFTEKQEELPELKEEKNEELKVETKETFPVESTEEINTETIVENEEEITSKVNMDDVIDKTTPKDDGQEVFENYKSVFDEDGKKIIRDKWNLKAENKESLIPKVVLAKEELKENIEEIAKIIVPKNKGPLWVILIAIVVLAMIWALFFFRSQILEFFKKDNNPPIENIIQLPNPPEDNTPTETVENNTNTTTENLTPTEQEDLNNFIEQVTGNNPSLSPEEIDKLIKKKIIEIYLKRNIR